MSDVITVAERVYREVNPQSKMDVPSIVYEAVEAANKRRHELKSKLSLYDFWYWEAAQKAVNQLSGDGRSQISDGYHNFEELYDFRKMYNAALFNEWAKQEVNNPDFKMFSGLPPRLIKYDVHKSWKHHDGELCFGGGWFIVVAVLPSGQISNHYKAEDWELFQIPSVEKAKYPFDGHTPADVLQRLKNL